ncbi:MAG: hypothetical protein ACR2PL_23575 [Dehalococcoidia bacterium]
MQSSLRQEILGWLSGYGAGTVSLLDFKQWFIPIAWTIELNNDPAAEDLAHTVELRLAEFSNGHWTDEELQDQLRLLLTSESLPALETS